MQLVNSDVKYTPGQFFTDFIALNWYDALISFLFRFVAKTSEPLLAVGVIVSAADFLQKGALMAHNPALLNAWSWTQALAIEASTGPVLVCALQAFREHDKLKGWLYGILATLLFVVGGSMLLLQLIASVTGLQETSITPWVLYSLFVLRVIVSGGYVALSCTKHIRFTGKVETPIADPVQPSLSDETVNLILQKLARLESMEKQLHALQQVQVQEVETPQLPETVKGKEETLQITSELPAVNMEVLIRQALLTSPDASSRDIAALVGCSHVTAGKWMKKITQA